ncbi:MAG: hypothetical protein HY831_00630 [Candidatus Aenigmarchaeota archaeon]|nr:hypothetical protein [Candidatus Aenigmarchaeota archaeon]
MVVSAEEIIGTLRVLGFYDFLLPWIFTFAVVYGLLIVANIFGPVNKKISAALALVAAFFVTAFAGRQLAAFFITLFGNATVILAGILVIILLLVMVGFDHKAKLGRSSVMIVLIIIGVILFIVSTGAASGIGYWGLLSPDMIALIIVLIVIIAAVYMIMREDGPGGGGGDKKKD